MPALAAALDRAAATGAQPSLVAAARAVLDASSPRAAPAFATLRGGLSALVVALLTASEAQLCCGQPVRALVPTATGWRLEIGPARLSTTRYLDADAVLLAVPPPTLRRLLTPLHPPAADAAAGVEIASSVIVSLALPVRAFSALRGSSGVLIASHEPLHSKAFTYSSVKWPHLRDADVTLLRASLDVTGAATARADDAELVDAVRTDLAKLTGINARPIDALVTRWGGGLPQYDVGHDVRVDAIESGVAQLARLAVAGAALHGIGVPACIATADAAARRLAAALSATA
jgi:oxygen-dependent protoporphyrinogen oxidase